MREFFEDGFYHGFTSDVAARERTNHATMMRSIRDAGGRLLVGTDAGFGWIIPGYSIHDEIGGFVDGGFTPADALRAARSAPARSVGLADEFGSIQPGLGADLVLLARNPLTDHTALRESSGVMVRGRWLSRGTLSAMVDAIERSNASGGGANSGALHSGRSRHPPARADPLP